MDLNLANPLTCSGSTLGGGQVINFEARVPILGFNVPEALMLRSNGESNYHGAQFSVTQRLSRGLHFNAAYTWSKSMDTSSTDPGSTAGSGKPDVPNTGFVVQGDQRNLDANRAVSDFDRTHRFSLNFVYEVPSSVPTANSLRAGSSRVSSRRKRARPTASSRQSLNFKLPPQYADLCAVQADFIGLALAGPAFAARCDYSKAPTSPKKHSIAALCARPLVKTAAWVEMFCGRQRNPGSTLES